MKLKKFLGLVVLVLVASTGYSKERGDLKKAKKATNKTLAQGCAPATSSADLDINNVRARILGSGDMWWDLNDAKYEVPKGSNKHSMFAGALWLGGIDEAQQLKLAAMTYRQKGVDYWPGPLTNDNTASVTAETCQRYNRHWVVYRDEVELHKAWIECKANPDCNVGEKFPGYGDASIPTDIKYWPGNGIDNELPYKLAPYVDNPDHGSPGFYDAEWDYPGYDIEGNQNCQLKQVDLLYGDQTIWWVYNDKGNVHTESQGGALGFEIHAQAFAFTSNDEVNNMTFYNYRIINRSTYTLTNTYFGTWFDPDLGNPIDDIIGCDVARGLGYCYNADNDDEGPNGYGQNPPAVGFDFFQGPFADYGDGVDNDRDGCVDGVRDTLGNCVPENEATGLNERIIMSGFMYYNNPGNFSGPTATTDPDNAQEFYNYLNSKWKNGNNLIIENPSGKGNNGNGDGYVASNQGTTTKFAYPGMSYDTTGAYEPSTPKDWWEAPQNHADKRGLHCAGPFSLQPGALNFITTGVVWARNFNSSDLFASVNDVIIADDKAQQLFDNCFKVLDGPDSPDLKIVELDRELIFTFQNAFTSKTIGYSQKDPAITTPNEWSSDERDSARKAGYFNYKFEGFQVFQVSGPDVSVDNLYDPSQSRLVFQCDLKNNVGQLVNYTVDPDLENGALQPQDMTLEASNNGIKLSFDLKEDAFATGDKRLVDNREYYFYVIAYAQNQYKIADPLNLSIPSQKKPYLAGRRIGNGQKPYLAIPHKVENTDGGTKLQSSYGDGLPITRFSGAGNSSNFLRITDETRNNIASARNVEKLDYQAGSGPFDVKVVDPTKVVAGTYRLSFFHKKGDPKYDVGAARWKLVDVSDPDANHAIVDSSEYPITFLGEQLIDSLGISVAFRNATRPGYDSLNINDNGVIGGEKVYRDSKKDWLTGVPDDDTYSPLNWIFGGSANTSDDPVGKYYNDIRDASTSPNADGLPIDPNGSFEHILGGTWAPSILGSTAPYPATDGFSVRPANGFGTYVQLKDLPNVDLVITPDPSKWTRCPVFEMGDVPETNEGGKRKFQLRSAPSLFLQPDGSLAPDPSSTSTGWSYFPGYAVDVSTGKRLCIAFGENSWLKGENGADMLWDPTNNLIGKFGPGSGLPQNDYKLGGMHAIYIATDSVNLLNIYKADLTYKDDQIANNPLKPLTDLVEVNYNLNVLRLFSAFAWTSIPLVSSSEYEFTDYRNIPTQVRVSLRVTKPYQRTQGPNGDFASAVNDGYPQYEFSTEGRNVVHSEEIAKSALDLIRVVPNPYYGSSEYEDSQLDNVVKITNLPQKCKIRIFMTNGTLIRTIEKDNSQSYVEWDLKNDYNVPIASGIYIIHIDAGNLGQKVVKWMGSLRPVDLNAF